MEAKDLFLSAIAELEIVGGGVDHFRTLRAAGLLRILLLDGHNLIEKARQLIGRKEAIEFEVVVQPSLAGVSAAVGVPMLMAFQPDGLFPGTAPPFMPRRKLSLQHFLKHTLIEIEGKQFSVREVVKFLANIEGGVHHDANPSSDGALLRSVNQELKVGNLDVITSHMRALARVVVEAAKPLREAMLRS